MNCPICDKHLKFNIPELELPSLNTDVHMDIDYECENEHKYFARITQEDLIEA